MSIPKITKDAFYPDDNSLSSVFSSPKGTPQPRKLKKFISPDGSIIKITLTSSYQVNSSYDFSSTTQHTLIFADTNKKDGELNPNEAFIFKGENQNSSNVYGGGVALSDSGKEEFNAISIPAMKKQYSSLTKGYSSTLHGNSGSGRLLPVETMTGGRHSKKEEKPHVAKKTFEGLQWLANLANKHVTKPEVDPSLNEYKSQLMEVPPTNKKK